MKSGLTFNFVKNSTVLGKELRRRFFYIFLILKKVHSANRLVIVILTAQQPALAIEIYYYLSSIITAGKEHVYAYFHENSNRQKVMRTVQFQHAF